MFAFSNGEELGCIVSYDVVCQMGASIGEDVDE